MPVPRAPDEQNTNNQEQHRSKTCDKPHRDGRIRDQGYPDHQVDDPVRPPEIADQRHRTKLLASTLSTSLPAAESAKCPLVRTRSAAHRHRARNTPWLSS